jgi:hypothetical protein
LPSTTHGAKLADQRLLFIRLCIRPRSDNLLYECIVLRFELSHLLLKLSPSLYLDSHFLLILLSIFLQRRVVGLKCSQGVAQLVYHLVRVLLLLCLLPLQMVHHGEQLVPFTCYPSLCLFLCASIGGRDIGVADICRRRTRR